MTLRPGDLVDDKYRIIRLLGEGGMGAVYEGENTRIHRRVAIKVLLSPVAGSADAVQRFEREAQAAGRIGSEHIVEVLDLGHLPDGDRYMVMEFLEGESLSQRIESRGRLQPQVVAPIIIELLEGLHAAHEAGIVHRDLKPDNVFLLANRSGHKDFVKILDFGISKFNTLNGEFSMTRTGAVMGTPYYMSPEQAKGNRAVDHRADLYAVGVILYEAIAGEVPFNAETFNELLFKIVLENPAPLTEKVPDLDPAFAAIVSKAMARDPEQRFQTARELQQALRAWLAGAPVVVETTYSQGTPNAVIAHSVAGGDAAQPVGQKTQGTWTASGDYSGPQKKAGAKVVVVALAAVVLLGLGGGWYMLSEEAKEAETRAAAQRAEEEKAAAARRAEELALEAERARLEAEQAKAERARIEAEALKMAAERERLEAERIAAEKAREEQQAKARPVQKPRPASASQTSKQEQPASSTASSGRVIRTDL